LINFFFDLTHLRPEIFVSSGFSSLKSDNGANSDFLLEESLVEVLNIKKKAIYFCKFFEN